MVTLLLLHLAATQAQPSQDPATCASRPPASFARLAELPKDVMEAFGEPIAEKGSPFQSTDVVATPPLPRDSFESAELEGCTLRLHYVQSGRAQSRQTATFFEDEAGWKLIGRSLDRGPRSK